MPRISATLDAPVDQAPSALVAELVEELRSPKEFGTPLVIETPIPRSSAKTVTVIWDKWHPYTDEFRIQTVLRALEEVEGSESLPDVAVVEALTIPEARDAGRLPFKIIGAFSQCTADDADSCRQAMIRCGASTLENPRYPELRFPNEQMAEKCREKLVRDVPGSGNVWRTAYDAGTATERDVFVPAN